MNAPRHGRRFLFFSVLAVCGCNPGPAAPRPAPTLAIGARAETTAQRLDPPAGASGPALALAWGGPDAGERLGVLYAGGPLAIYRPDRGGEPISAGRAGTARGLAILAADRVVTSDEAGVQLWDASTADCRRLGRLDLGPISTLAVEPDGGDLLAGGEDGRLFRIRISADRSGLKPRNERPADRPSSGVRQIVPLEGGHELAVVRADGRVLRLRRDLGGPAADWGRAARVVPLGPDRLARLRPGPALAIDPETPGRPAHQMSLTGSASGLVALEGGATLAIAGEGGLRLVAVRELERGDPLGVQVIPPSSGASLLAVDPVERLALADGSGRVECLTRSDLRARARPITPDEVPEWAFQPARRFYRPAAGDPGAPPALLERFEAARSALDRGRLDPLMSELRALDVQPALDRRAAAELRAMVAALQQRSDSNRVDVLKSLEAARTGFERVGATARQADLRRWQALVLMPPLDGSRSEPAEAAEALLRIEQARALDRAAGTPDGRQARLDEAVRAWCLLALGDIRGATRAFGPVAEAARADPLLGQVVELDRIAAALAAARRDWPAAAGLDRRALDGLDRSAEPRPALRREARRALLSSLAALGRWEEALQALESGDPADPEWRVRRPVLLSRAGHPAEPRPTDEDPVSSHLRGLALSGSPARLRDAAEELARAADGHRQAGRDDLAAEADLVRAEALERLGQFEPAAELYATLARQSAALAGTLRARLAPPAWLGDPARPFRGLARCALALDRPAVALAALDAADATVWADRVGESTAQAAALGVPADESDRLDALHAARLAAERAEPTLSEQLEAPLARVRRLEAAVASARPAPGPIDPALPFDASALGLAADEAALIVAPLGPESLAIGLVRGGSAAEVRVAPLSRSEVRRAVASWRAGLGEGGRPLRPDVGANPSALVGLGPEPDAPRPRGTVPAGSRAEGVLYDALVGPFEPRLSGVNRLIVVPDATVAALPLEVVGRTNRLMQRFRIGYAPSLSMLRLMRSTARRELEHPNSALLLAKRDAAGMEEVAGAWSESGWEVERSRRLVESPPRGFGLVLLDGEAPRDGRLTVADLAGLPLQVGVLVLAVGDRAGADGPALRDLARAGLAADAGAVLVALWDPPPASSRRFLAEFGLGLGTGEPPARALDRARLAVARDPSSRDPVHWAGFVLYGRSR